MSALLKHPQVFKKQDVMDYTEFDYYTKVWQPLYEVMFEGSSIRIKSSESTFPYSTCRKRKQYPAAKNVIAFKIDIRFLIDYKREEYDICSGEMTEVDDHDKMVLDKAKLNRESKDDLDCLLDLHGDDA